MTAQMVRETSDNLLVDIDGPGKVSAVERESTYTSLVQQYLQVMCLENATFLAERMVASCQSTNSRYLLAVCHYRSNKPQYAQSILEDIVYPTPASQYLLAKCYFDRRQYGSAEAALLKLARTEYKSYKSGLSSDSQPLSIDEWLLETSPCPVPNGAAGFYLLGNICQRSSRKARAMDYYRMSLQLDPLMWSSFEALCEMGAKDIDPTSVFGVRPAELNHLQGPPRVSHTQPLQERFPTSPSFSSIHPLQHQTPKPDRDMYAGRPFRGGEMQTPSEAGSAVKASLFQTAYKPNRSSLTSASGHRATTLQFDTPNLTPIPVQEDASFAPHQQASEVSFAVGVINPATVRRAKDVASRRYYPPSPETPDSGAIDAVAAGGGDGGGGGSLSFTGGYASHSYSSGVYLRGVSKKVLFSSEIDFSDTPLRRGGRPSMDSTMSTVRKPRALFAASDVKSGCVDPALDEESALKHEESPVNEATSYPLQGQQSIHVSTPIPDDITTDRLNQFDATTESAKEILELLCVLGAAWWRLCQYRCREALQLLNRLPHAQHNTGWVLHQEGRSYFEMAEYQNAQRSLELMRKVEPSRMRGLELLSTVLWQLKKEMEISHLAQVSLDFDHLSPEAWCVAGNCFSLQKEHETALIFFGRSLQLDPRFTYTHTLSGHEYMANEDFDKAIACFRNAIRSDERHYNAWYGLGAIYHRQEKYDLAEYHFQRAVSINPQSSVLRCNLGMSQSANGKTFEALDTLTEASRLDPNNPQARFQRATIFVGINRPEEALAELEKVRDAAPGEATIHFAMGKVLKRLGRPEAAMKCFLTALDLDPKDNQLIKSAMDKLNEPDVDEEVAAF